MALTMKKADVGVSTSGINDLEKQVLKEVLEATQVCSVNSKEYKTLEKKMTDVAKAYYGEKPGLLKNNETISIQDLSDYDNTLTNKVNEEECNGYVKTTSNMGIFEYKAYIKCNEYTTKGYVNQSST